MAEAKKQKKTYTYHVTLHIPNSKNTHEETDVPGVSNQFDAKCEASKVFFNRVFTGTFKYMKATRNQSN